MLSKTQNHAKKKGGTRLAAIRVSEIDDSLEWFGNYTPHGETPVILMPSRSSCLPYIYIPEGTYAVITKHGELFDIRKTGGIYFCLPWTQIQYLVTQQHVVFETTVKSCPTYDNIFIEIEVGAVFKCKEDEKSIEAFVYNISMGDMG